MSCTPLQTELTQLRARREEQELAVEMLPPHKKPLAQAVLDDIIADINATQAALDLCLAQEAQAENPVPQRILAKVEKIQCHDASKEVGADEPYLLIASFDMTLSVNLGIVRLPFPGINVVKVGPWAGVGAGETHQVGSLSSSPRPFWNLSGEASTIAHPQAVIFLVACMEHDGSSPDGIRGLVRDALLAARTTNTDLAYDAYVSNMVSNMTATIDTARLVPGKPSINFDDLIGGVQRLALSSEDLSTLNRLEPVTKTLRFTQRTVSGKVQNDYTATFSFSV